jgi:hypothetical protein
MTTHASDSASAADLGRAAEVTCCQLQGPARACQAGDGQALPCRNQQKTKKTHNMLLICFKGVKNVSAVWARYAVPWQKSPPR